MLSLRKPEEYKPLNFEEAFFLATLGGSQGNFFNWLMSMVAVLIFFPDMMFFLDQMNDFKIHETLGNY